MNLLFRIKEIETGTRFRKFEVTVDESRLEEIRNDDIMTLVDVEEEVLDLQPMVEDETKLFLESLKNGIEKIEVPLTKDCFQCEFDIADEAISTSGFDECWKEMPQVEHHIKDLHKVGLIGGWENPKANKWIENKILSMYDVPEEELTGKIGERNLIQIKYTKENNEWIGPNFKKQIASCRYPLHFIDFETFIGALPFHKNMRPYELIGFQWRCHSINKPGDEPVHSEWINLEPEFPSFSFTEALMSQIGDEGTPFMWSHHENTVLRTIYNQLDFCKYDNPQLKRWLEGIIRFENDDGRFFDMEKLALHEYFHPGMKGKTSIKWVLPSILNSHESERIENWLKNFEECLSLFKKDEDGELVNPYKLLPHIDIYERSEQINEGTGAMRAYGELMFGLKKGDEEVKEKYKNALLKYCKLDTLSMVIIWEHWNSIS